MKKGIIWILVVLWLLNIRISNAEDITWSDCKTYGPTPILFIHGINSNMLTWEKTISQLEEKYFRYYRLTRFNEEPTEGYISSDEGDRTRGVTYFEDKKYKSPAKLYLEAFEYGRKDTKGSFYPLDSYYEKLKDDVEKILSAYYNDNYKNKGENGVKPRM